ncbi:hypothetical protein ACFQ12_14890, partial [Methylobacterium trifolii]
MTAPVGDSLRGFWSGILSDDRPAMIAPRSDARRRAALVVGGCGVVVFGWALVAYAPAPGIAAAVVAVPAFAR